MRTRSATPSSRRFRLPRSVRTRYAVAVLGCTVVALTAAPLVLADTAPKAAAAAPRPLRVLTDNVMFLPPVVADYANGTRADLIAKADHLRGHDVVVLQELFDNGPSDRLLTGLAGQYPHRTPVVGRSRHGWDRTAGHYGDLTLEDGGVAVLSKWPIRQRVQYVYDRACGADRFSNKGFVYTDLDVAGTRVHVVGTHVQAEDPACRPGEAAQVRASQFRELDAFVDALRIPKKEPVIIAGDLNVIRQSAEYPTMLRALDVAAPEQFRGHPFSFDPVGNTIAADRYPGTAREHLDYVLLRNGQARPAGWVNQTITDRTQWSMTRWFRSYSYTDFSDHYPVVGFPA